MKSHIKFSIVGILLLGSLLMLGCAPVVEAQSIDRIDVTFDGESCSYDGPEVIFEGVVVVAIDNLTEDPTIVGLSQINEGYTWQDVLDYYGEPGSTSGRPTWLVRLNSSFSIDEPNAYEYTLEPGLYAILCARTSATGLGVFSAAPLEVRAAP